MENNARNLKSAIGATLKVTGTKTETNKFGREVLTIYTDDGEAFATTSKAFAETFAKASEISDFIRVVSKTSKAGYDYIIAEPVGALFVNTSED